jgi:hypothetical protein
LQLPVLYKANPDFVRSVSSVAALREFEGGDLVSNEVTMTSDSRQISDVSLRLKQSKSSSEYGLLAKEEIRYALQLKTASHCLELQPGCLEVKEKKVLKTISVKGMM